MEAARRRPQASLRLLVHPRFSRAAAERLAAPGGGAGETDRLWGGARDQGLGRPAAAPGVRPPLLRILPSRTTRRAADLRRSRVGAGTGHGHAAAARTGDG